MSEPQVEPTDLAKAGTRSRAAAAIGGIVVAIVTGIVTGGLAIVAVLGVLVAWAVARRRAKPLTRGVSWLAGFGTVAAALLIGGAVLATHIPPGSMAAMRHAMDSAAAVPPPPPPEWLRRITPPAAQVPNPKAEQLIRSRAFTVWAGVVSVVFGVGLLAGVTGSLGWAASVLLLYGITGRWLPKAAPSDNR